MSTIDQPTPERTTTVNDNYTPDWDGALAVKGCDGKRWHCTNDGYHQLGVARSAAYVEERWGPVTVVTPAPAPEPRTLTWRKDGTGCTWGELVAEFREGRQVERVIERNRVVSTHRGPLESGLGDAWWIGGSVFCASSQIDVISITVWLPEVPEVPEWAQDYDIPGDARAVITDDKRVWRPAVANAAHIETWRWKGNRATEAATTEELVTMGGRLLINPDGKAVQ